MKNSIWMMTIALFFILFACHEEVDEPSERIEKGIATFNMGFTVPAMNTLTSRSLSDPLGTTDFPALWVVVFDGTGYLVEYAKARQFERTETAVRFKVTLRATSQKRILHFILGDKENLQLKFGHESNVIGNKVTEFNQGVYWQRKVMNHGIDSTIVQKELQKVPLLRNFAKIKVVNRDRQDFSLTGFYVLNISSAGTVAPYSHGQFVDYSTGVGLTAKDYSTLVDKEGYIGSQTPRRDLLHRPGDEDDGLEWIPDAGEFLLYEHTHTDDPATTLSVMLKGRYRGGEERYYKVDLVRQEADRAVYYHILRNFEYFVNINEVVGEGAKDFKEACRGLSGNNLSSSVVVRKVLNVSDGTAALRVAYTDTTLVSAAPVQLRCRYVPNLSQPQRTANHLLDATLLNGPDGRLFDARVDKEETTDGWAIFTFIPLGLPPYPKTQKVLIACRENQLNRQVNFELRPLFSLSVECMPKTVAKRRGESVFLDILLPDQLGEPLFPLKFNIEAQQLGNTDYLFNTLSPHSDEVMAVATDKSMAEGFLSQPAIQYVKSLSYEDYLGLPKAENGVSHRLHCHFVTHTAHNAATVYVYNKYFGKVADSFGN